jgi:hypothetical protein
VYKKIEDPQQQQTTTTTTTTNQQSTNIKRKVINNEIQRQSQSNNGISYIIDNDSVHSMDIIGVSNFEYFWSLLQH